jgi:hypothetical protein
MYSYAREFGEAVIFTRQIGCITPIFDFRDKLYCNPDAMTKIGNFLDKMMAKKNILIEDFCANCLNANIFLVKELSNLLRCKAIVTLGYITIKGPREDLYRFSCEDLQRWIEPEFLTNSANAHAWITLESGEVIDLTLLTSIAIVKNCDGKGAFFGGRPEEPGISVEFHPIAVGRDVIEKAFGIRNAL